MQAVTKESISEILILKTNIRLSEDFKIVESVLNLCSSIIRWNIDLDDVDKVLRVESSTNNVQEIINLVREAGYYCEELEDEK